MPVFGNEQNGFLFVIRIVCGSRRGLGERKNCAMRRTNAFVSAVEVARPRSLQ